MRTLIVAGVLATTLSGCGQSDRRAANEAAVNAAQPKKPAYCFFKEDETKGWAASRGKDGTVTLTGKAHVKDPRYKAMLGAPTISGTTAEFSPTIGQNDGYAAPDDWWDLNAPIADSAAVDHVVVRCGDRTLADLKVPLQP